MDGRTINQNPMHMPSWSVGMACVWIAHRSPQAAQRLWNSGFEEALLNADDTGNDPIQSARQELVNALILGKLQATGLVNNGQRMAIPQFEWEDMREFSYDLRDDEGLVHKAESAAGLRYTDFRVPRAEVQRLWPEIATPSASILEFSPRQRGPKPKVYERVLADMRGFTDKEVLNSMTEEALAAQFNASRETCRKARNAILSE